MSNEIRFTLDTLRRFNGDGTPAYIAYAGVVYDVSGSRRWRKGLHENLHWAGQDLTSELSFAPHKDEVFRHPNIKRVGILVDS